MVHGDMKTSTVLISESEDCSTGQFIITMFVFVNRLSFTLSCLASIFFYIGTCQSRSSNLC